MVFRGFLLWRLSGSSFVAIVWRPLLDVVGIIIYIYIYIYIHKYIYIYMNICIFMYIYTYPECSNAVFG